MIAAVTPEKIEEVKRRHSDALSRLEVLFTDSERVAREVLAELEPTEDPDVRR